MIALLPALACPLVMGGAVWLLSRGGRSSAATATAPSGSAQARASTDPASGARAALMTRAAMRGGIRLGPLCLSWRVLAGLAAAAVATFVLAPEVMPILVPLLIAAACPLSMVVMMRGGQQAHRRAEPEARPRRESSVEPLPPTG